MLIAKKGYNKQTEADFSKKVCLHLKKVYDRICGEGFCLSLVPIAETERKFEPMLACKGSTRPD